MLCETEGGHLWFSSAGFGLVHFDVNTQQFNYLFHKENDKNSLVGNFARRTCEGGKDTLWIATNTGLSCYDIRNQRFTNFTLNNGLRGGNLVYDVMPDKKGGIWFTTNQYLTRYDTRSRQFFYYNRANGFETNFNRASIFLDEKGVLYVGGINGLVVCDPGNIKQNTAIPRVVLTNFTVKNQPKTRAAGRRLPRARRRVAARGKAVEDH